jgi:hypothetical protein
MAGDRARRLVGESPRGTRQGRPRRSQQVKPRALSRRGVDDGAPERAASLLTHRRAVRPTPSNDVNPREFAPCFPRRVARREAGVGGSDPGRSSVKAPTYGLTSAWLAEPRRGPALPGSEPLTFREVERSGILVAGAVPQQAGEHGRRIAATGMLLRSTSRLDTPRGYQDGAGSQELQRHRQAPYFDGCAYSDRHCRAEGARGGDEARATVGVGGLRLLAPPRERNGTLFAGRPKPTYWGTLLSTPSSRLLKPRLKHRPGPHAQRRDQFRPDGTHERRGYPPYDNPCHHNL